MTDVTATNTDQTMDMLHKIESELRFLGAIVGLADVEDGNSVLIEPTTLHRLGYVLTYDRVNKIPVFTALEDFAQLYDWPLYCGTRVPRRALLSYIVSRIKTFMFSSKN